MKERNVLLIKQTVLLIEQSVLQIEFNVPLIKLRGFIDYQSISTFYRLYIDILQFVLSVERTVECRYNIDKISVLIKYR